MSYPTSLPRERSPKPPLHTNAVDEKLYLMRKNSPQNSRLASPIPLGARTRTQFTERRIIATLLLFLTWLALGWMGYISAPGTTLSSLFRKRAAVFGQADLEKMWRWEIASGHYPSTRSVPAFVGTQVQNPGLPAEADKSGHSSRTASTTGTGPARTYISTQNVPSRAKYPPRPLPGGIADLDIVMDRCDFSTHKYVRDCLEFMRIGAGLDLHEQPRLTHPSFYEFIYLENNQTTLPDATDYDAYSAPERKASPARIFNRHRPESLPPLPPPRQPKPLDDACDPDHPRIFHAYWVGEFTDKPYMALLSYLFTQNLGLDRKIGAPLPTNSCRPQFWVWINPGPAAAAPNPVAEKDIFDSLRANPWARPFLHPRFADVIKFKMWNTTEQLDSVPELKDEWRAYRGNFYDQPSTVLSDVARFVLCHRFGGTYLDADTILLRDWEELWGYKGAFAYRWSRLETYSTAVLRLNKGSALGTFLFRTALRHGLDFHPMVVWKYVQQANLEGLLLRLPDALFDSAWLNTEGYQRERPALPYFTQFEKFFEPSKAEPGSPSVVGFDGFFRGAYSYHFHNSWWLPFDPARNYPDLGSRFARGETLAKENPASEQPKAGTGAGEEQEDLSWAAVLKRTFETFLRGERPNMYGEWIEW